MRRSFQLVSIRRARLAVAAALALGCVGTTASTALAVSSAEVYTPDGLGYGRYEARLMFPAGDGVVGAFFLWKAGSEVSGAYWNELDFEKVKADCSLQLNSNYGAPEVQHPNLLNAMSSLCTGYHTYGYEWTPDHVSWLIDGNEVRRDTGAGAQAYTDNALSEGLQIHFNIWPGNSNFGGTFAASVLPVYQYISWVQYSAYTPCGGDAGGDFTLAWRESFEQGVPASWAEGNWASPFSLSTHSPSNVTATNGIAVLSLTADDMLGFTGTPPADDGDLPSVQAAPDGSAPACGAGTGPLADGGATGGNGASGAGGHSGGGGCRVGGAGAGDGGWPSVVAMLAMAGMLVRRRGHWSARSIGAIGRTTT